MVELEVLESNLSGFKELGAQVVALCPQLEKHNESIANELGLSFPVVTDRGNRLATAFGLTTVMPPEVIAAEQFLGLDLPTHNGTDSWDLPIPARYVVDRSGVVRLATVHVDHRDRSDPADLLAMIKSI